MKLRMPRLRLSSRMAQARRLTRAATALQRVWLDAARPAPAVPAHQGAFSTHRYRNAAGSRSYKLYTPIGYRDESLPVLVMLHGCGQDPDELAAATRMNQLADELRLLVVYPAQARTANPSKCWNWYQAGHQQRNGGEPSLIAGITRRVARGHDARRIYIAGHSAGGAMAAVMGATYPELYAAVGVHSGLAHGAAHDLASALAAMRSGSAAIHQADLAGGPAPRIISIHGDEDSTVHAGNSRVAPRAGTRAEVEQGERNGRAYTRTAQLDAQGRPVVEHWIIHGAGHAWSGGGSGRYADARGPDASREMLRFFLGGTR